MKTKSFIALSILLGVFFLFSFLTKAVTAVDWFEFNYSLIGSSFGYVNATLVLLVEGIFAFQFLRRKISLELLVSSFLFVFLLTLFVFFNQDLFKSCMCFGSVIDVKPDWKFATKNIIILVALAINSYMFIQIKDQNSVT